MSPPDAPRPPAGTGGRADHPARKITPDGTPRTCAAVDLEAQDAAAEADRIYFEAHPDERERIRLAMPGEWCDCVGWVRVVNLGPGVRARLAWTGHP